MYNNACIQLSQSGNWNIQFELQRKRCDDYPGSDFNNFTGFLIEKDREINFKYDKQHFKNRYFLIFTYYLPSQTETKLKSFVMKSNNDDKDKRELDNLRNELKNFKMQTSKVVSVLSTIMYIEKLDSNKLLELFHSSVSLNWQKMEYNQEHHIFLVFY